MQEGRTDPTQTLTYFFHSALHGATSLSSGAKLALEVTLPASPRRVLHLPVERTTKSTWSEAHKMQHAFVPSISLNHSRTLITSTLVSRHDVSKPRFRPRPPIRAQLTTESNEASITAISAAPNSAFGRGAQFPRRLVGLYELEREGIDPSALFAKDSRDELAFGAVIGFFVLSIVVFPLITPGPSLEGPLSVIIAVLLTVWAVDSLSLGGMLGRATSLAVQNRKRIGYHEAGHFLVGFLLGFDIEGYRLPSPAAVLRKDEGAPGVTFGTCRAAGDAHCVSAVGLAGIAGEVVKYGTSEGGAEDMADVSKGIKACYGGRQVMEATMKSTVRWGLIESVKLLKEHAEAHDKLCQAMLAGNTTEECLSIAERFIDKEKLVEKAYLAA